jgi:hypothetical protein
VRPSLKVNCIGLNVVLLAASVPGPLAWLVGIILVLLLPIACGMAVGYLLTLVGRMRRAQTPQPAERRPANPGQKPGGKK